MDPLPNRLPLLIGATGHRDLRDQDIPALEREVGKAIERLKHEYLHDSPETPIIVLSALAEGADRLIARVAMAHGAKLIAPLPMEAAEYRFDFEPQNCIKSDAAEEFDYLISKALAAPVMPFAAGNTAENIREEPRRALQYREVGLFIVRHCHVLIALWDGDESNTAIGGTAEVVRFKRDGVPPEVAQSAPATLDAPEIGLVIHIVTPRSKSREPVPPVRTHAWGADLGSDGSGNVDKAHLEAWENFKRKIGLTQRFNEQAAERERDPTRA